MRPISSEWPFRKLKILSPARKTFSIATDLPGGDATMPIKVLMPALSPTMTEGKVARWLKNEGDAVKSGDVLAEIETDKATMEVEAVDEGKLGRILVPGGTENVKVNTPIAVILEEGEDASSVKAKAPPAATRAPEAPAIAKTAAPSA